MKHIKNIIFDLGGVIINLDINKTIAEFNKLTDLKFEDIYTQAQQADLFNNLDKGTISPEEFFKGLRNELKYIQEDDLLIFAWNAMLLDIPEKRLDVLVKAKQNYNTFLLSNTNEPHIAVFEKNLYRQHGVKNFEDYFDKVYYSCRMNMRKPDKEIFEHVLKDNELDPAETVFIDDSIQHVRGAGECGINSYLLPKNMEVGDLLKELKLL
ncbi:MAG: HAD family phosphatase [Bacteroidetes bacterium]|nr:HAD family phosphatase [Bacteroidota bacterium]